jgi:hypothetical protein
MGKARVSSSLKDEGSRRAICLFVKPSGVECQSSRKRVIWSQFQPMTKDYHEPVGPTTNRRFAL